MKDWGRKGLSVVLIVTAAGLFGGCAHWGVKPHEREFLAQPDMQIDPNPVDSAFNDHIYFSIEGSSGGRSFGGGGCGCN